MNPMNPMSPVARTQRIQGVEVPTFLYGTAWKEEETQRLTELALAAGFRGVDTANQRRHYHEAAVGAGVAAAIARGEVTRDALFLQTKFTYRAGQDHRLPYDPAAPPAEQVAQSFASSCEHLGSDVIDAYLLHGPQTRGLLTETDREVWRAMESLHRAGRARLLGISNVSLPQLAQLHADAEIPPVLVQNRCFAQMGWDADVRAFCREHGLLYQGFSLLTANHRVLAGSAAFRALVERLGRPWPQIVFRAALQLGMIPLTGTSDRGHMDDDLAAYDLTLAGEDVALIERVALG